MISKGKWVKIGLALSVAFNLFLVQLGLAYPAPDGLSDVLVNRLPNLILVLLQIPLFWGKHTSSLPTVIRSWFTNLIGFSLLNVAHMFMTIHMSRAYSGTKDLQSMIDLLGTVRPTDRITDYPSAVDLHEAFALNNVQDNTRLWFDAQDQIVGFAFVDQYNNLQFEIKQQAVHPDIESEIVTWGEECIRHAMHASDESLTLDASCRDDDTERIALFEKHGFAMQKMRTLRMIRSLNEPIPTPQLPADFSIRHVAGEQEVKALVALHRAAFGTENMTVEERLAMMHVPEYDVGLDLLAIAPDGKFAAYCMCSIRQEENERTGRNEGYTDPIATHPDFQRCGLARALLLTGLDKLKQRGIDTAVLGTSSENVAMLRTAQAVGFRVQSTTLWFSKPVSQDQVTD